MLLYDSRLVCHNCVMSTALSTGLRDVEGTMIHTRFAVKSHIYNSCLLKDLYLFVKMFICTKKNLHFCP